MIEVVTYLQALWPRFLLRAGALVTWQQVWWAEASITMSASNVSNWRPVGTVTGTQQQSTGFENSQRE